MTRGRSLLLSLPLLALLLLSHGCAQNQAREADAARPEVPAQDTTVKQAAQPAPEQEEGKQGNVLKGKITGKSRKAKTITIMAGKGDKAKSVMLKFDDKTQGLEHAHKGHGAIITYEERDGELFAVSIKPKLAKLPKGVTEITVDELTRLMEAKAEEDFVLTDSRPAKRYHQAHIPGAISIPVCEMDELHGRLPREKDKLLIFYCGGPT